MQTKWNRLREDNREGPPQQQEIPNATSSKETNDKASSLLKSSLFGGSSSTNKTQKSMGSESTMSITGQGNGKNLASWIVGDSEDGLNRNILNQTLDKTKSPTNRLHLKSWFQSKSDGEKPPSSEEVRNPQINKIRQWFVKDPSPGRVTEGVDSTLGRRNIFQQLFPLSKEPKVSQQREESRLAIPSSSTSAFVERTKAQLEDLRKQAESSVAVVKAKEQVDLVKHQMVTKSVEVKDQVVVKSKEIIQRSRNASINYGKQKLDDASAVIKDMVDKVKQTPVEIARNVKSTSDHIAMKSIAQARKARNFMVGVFIGGCFAFGLGLGLGSGGLRWRNDRDQ